MKKRRNVFMAWLLLGCLIFSGEWGIKITQAKTAEPESVQVLGTVYRNGSVLFDGVTSATMTAKVPYFNLENYGLGQYALKDAKGDAVKKPTLLHGIICLIEKCWLEAGEADLGTGKYKDDILAESQNNEVKYYYGDYTPSVIAQTGGAMLEMDQDGKPASLWGFRDHVMKIYMNQKLVERGIHEVLLEDLNVLEIMLISKDNQRTIMYPRFSEKCFRIRPGETAKASVEYLDLDGQPFDQFTTKSLLVSDESGKQFISKSITDENNIIIGPFEKPGVYTAKLIFYPFYFRQLIVVSDPAADNDPEDGTHVEDGDKPDDGKGDGNEEKNSPQNPPKIPPKNPEASSTQQEQQASTQQEQQASTESSADSSKIPEKDKETAKAKLAAEKKKIQKINIVSLKAVKYQSSGVKMTWKKNSKMDGYEVFRSTKQNNGYRLVKTLKGAGQTTYFVKKGLKKSTDYYYRIRGYKIIGSEKAYTPYARIVVNLNKKKAVKNISLSGLQANIKKGSVLLSWKKPASMYQMGGYKIYLSSKKNSGYRQVASVKKTAAAIKKIPKKKICYIKVRGYVKIGKELVYTKAKIITIKIKNDSGMSG